MRVKIFTTAGDACFTSGANDRVIACALPGTVFWASALPMNPVYAGHATATTIAITRVWRK